MDLIVFTANCRSQFVKKKKSLYIEWCTKSHHILVNMFLNVTVITEICSAATVILHSTFLLEQVVSFFIEIVVTSAVFALNLL